MSGGVDSSVAAFLLKEKEHDVTGIYINGYNVDGCAERDAQDARHAAEHIGIPFYTIDAREEYFKRVVEYMVSEYARGRTPNPDVMCNKEIKFGLFLKKALDLGAHYIATGHYTSLEERNSLFHIFEGKDKNKDQSYFLWTLTQKELRHSLFPIGEYTKEEIRKKAKDIKLPNAEKKDSQGICFLGQVKLPEFLKRFIEPKQGDIFDTEGNKVGEHEGVQFYTIGQRRIGTSAIHKNSKTNPKPFYVVEKNIKNNTLIVAEGDENPSLFRNQVVLEDTNFVSGRVVSGNVLVRIRYRQELLEGSLAKNKDAIHIDFKKPVRFVAPGQSAVLYSQEIDKNTGTHELLGGGVIS